MALRTAMSSAIGLLLMTKCPGATIRDRRALPAVNNGPWVASELGPLIPQQRTCSDYCGMSVLCQQETHALQQTNALFNHMISADQERLRNGKTKPFCGSHIYDQFE